MNKVKKMAILTAVVGLLLVASPAAAKKDSKSPAVKETPKSPADYNGLHKGEGNAKHLYLYEKDPETWEVVPDGAWGKMTYKEDSFVFNGHGLEPDMEYTLIRYTDPWPGYPVVCLDSGTSNNGGNVHLSGDMLMGGYKVWLVLSEDVDCEEQIMTGWNPTEYLFEYHLIDGWLGKMFVNANEPAPIVSSFSLENDVDYMLKAIGTADAGDTIDFDAKYSITNRIVGDTWTDLVSGYESLGPELLDLQVNGASVDWGDYNEDHTYWYLMTGDGNPVELRIYDTYYPNNTGSLEVEVYKL